MKVSFVSIAALGLVVGLLGSAAQAAMESNARDAGAQSRPIARAFELAKDQHRRLSSGLEQIEAHPVVFQHAFVQQFDHLLHEFLRVPRGLSESADFFAGFLNLVGNHHA